MEKAYLSDEILSTSDVSSYNRAGSVNFYECYYRTKNTAVMPVKAYHGLSTAKRLRHS